jgi:hypothetical protein
MTPATDPQGAPPSPADAKVVMTKVFVTGVEVQAEIGVYRHEIGRVQPLKVDVELDVPTAGADLRRTPRPRLPRRPTRHQGPRPRGEAPGPRPPRRRRRRRDHRDPLRPAEVSKL